MNTQTAIEIAGTGLAALRSVTQPAEFVRCGDVWLLRDTGAKPKRDNSVLTFHLEPGEVIEKLKLLELENSGSAEELGPPNACAVGWCQPSS